MPPYSKPINNYQVTYRSLHDIHAEITCTSGTGEQVCRLAFYDDARPMPVRNTFLGTSTLPTLAFRSSQFVAMLTLLREEKPVFLAFNPDTMTGWINTGIEPAGEDEGP
ncbi:MAG: hypothetical protein ACRDZ3_13695 [Acidimicrobiia bacterium]